jgi:hypothetical protein
MEFVEKVWSETATEFNLQTRLFAMVHQGTGLNAPRNRRFQRSPENIYPTI